MKDASAHLGPIQRLLWAFAGGDPAGAPLAAPLDVETEVAWVGYANPKVRRRVEPHLQAALRRRGLLPPGAGA